MTRHALPDSLLGVWLWVLAACLPAAVLGQANYATPYTFTTLAGNNGCGSADGTNSAARFNKPCGVAVDSAGNLYVADYNNSTIPTFPLTRAASMKGWHVRKQIESVKYQV
jgi:DNA-binding beta-propeller fold protein YncE